MKTLVKLFAFLIAFPVLAFEHTFYRGFNIYDQNINGEKIKIVCDSDTEYRQGSFIYFTDYSFEENKQIDFSLGDAHFNGFSNGDHWRLENTNEYNDFVEAWKNNNILKTNIAGKVTSYDISSINSDFCILQKNI